MFFLYVSAFRSRTCFGKILLMSGLRFFQRVAFANKFSGANFCFSCLVVVSWFLVVFCLCFCFMFRIFAPGDVLEKLSWCQVLVFVGKNFWPSFLLLPSCSSWWPAWVLLLCLLACLPPGRLRQGGGPAQHCAFSFCLSTFPSPLSARVGRLPLLFSRLLPSLSLSLSFSLFFLFLSCVQESHLLSCVCLLFLVLSVLSVFAWVRSVAEAYLKGLYSDESVSQSVSQSVSSPVL